MKNLSAEDKATALDRLKYVKNTASANLCYLGILFDVFFFVSIYKSDVGSWYYTLLIGISVVYNLVFLLIAFLASEGVKSYTKSFTWVLTALGLGQLVRIFIIPMKAHSYEVPVNGVAQLVMGTPQFTRVVIYLIASAVCLIGAAVINYQKCAQLASVSGGEVK